MLSLRQVLMLAAIGAGQETQDSLDQDIIGGTMLRMFEPGISMGLSHREEIDTSKAVENCIHGSFSIAGYLQGSPYRASERDDLNLRR